MTLRTTKTVAASLGITVREVKHMASLGLLNMTRGDGPPKVADEDLGDCIRLILRTRDVDNTAIEAADLSWVTIGSLNWGRFFS